MIRMIFQSLAVDFLSFGFLTLIKVEVTYKPVGIAPALRIGEVRFTDFQGFFP